LQINASIPELLGTIIRPLPLDHLGSEPDIDKFRKQPQTVTSGTA